MSNKQKPTDLGKYNADQLQNMPFRELEALSESWSRPLGFGAEYTPDEIEATRLATRIFIRRRDAMRKVAPELLDLLKEMEAVWKDGVTCNFPRGCRFSHKVLEAIAKSEGRE